MGPNGIIQGALESILEDQPQTFFDDSVDIIKVCRILKRDLEAAAVLSKREFYIAVPFPV